MSHRDDGGVARIAGQQCQFAKKVPCPETYTFRHHSNFDFSGSDKIHAVALLAAPDDDGPRRIIAWPQKLCDIGDHCGTDVVEERNLGDEVPGSQKLAPPDLLEVAGRENAGPQGDDGNTADHDDPSQHAAKHGLRYSIAVTGGCHRDDRPPQRRRNRAEDFGLGRALQAGKRGSPPVAEGCRSREEPRATLAGHC